MERCSGHAHRRRHRHTPTGTSKHRRSHAHSQPQAPAGTHPRAHTHLCGPHSPIGPTAPPTVSGRFLSLSSLRSKHWLIMGFSELHMVCEGRARGQGCSRIDSWGTGHLGPNLDSSPQPPSPPSDSGRAGRCFYPETLRGESTCELRKSPSPPTVGPQHQHPHRSRCRLLPQRSAGGGTPLGPEISWSAGQPACAWG